MGYSSVRSKDRSVIYYFLNIIVIQPETFFLFQSALRGLHIWTLSRCLRMNMGNFRITVKVVNAVFTGKIIPVKTKEAFPDEDDKILLKA